jgi:hypothetical protein
LLPLLLLSVWMLLWRWSADGAGGRVRVEGAMPVVPDAAFVAMSKLALRLRESSCDRMRSMQLYKMWRSA